jgi:hypothetical protein
MKYIILILVLLSSIEAKAEEFGLDPEERIVAPAEDEVETLQHLIALTEHQLTVQKQLRNLMTDFKKQKDRFFKGDQSRKHSLKMVKTARNILQIVTESHLQHLYSSEYMEELTLFSSIAGKNTPCRP